MENKNTKIRVFVSADLSVGGAVSLDESQGHYLVHVMRRKIGDNILLFNGKNGEFLATITNIKKQDVTLSVQEKTKEFQATEELVLFLPIIKKQAFDYALQKATECGATQIYPIQTEYTDIPKLNVERAQLIVQEAAEQCRRLDVPEVFPVRKLKESIQKDFKDKIVYTGAEDGRGQSIKDAFSAKETAALLIGPEGGFSPQEFELLASVPQVKFIDLGARILKAETAVVAGLTLINFVREN